MGGIRAASSGSMTVKRPDGSTPRATSPFSAPPVTGRVALFQGLLKALRRRLPSQAIAAPPAKGAALMTAARREGTERAREQRVEREARGGRLTALTDHRRAELEAERPGSPPFLPREPLPIGSSMPPALSPASTAIGLAADNPGSGSSGGRDHAQEAIDMVETIQAFVRSGRPALELTLKGAWPGTVAIERSGPSSVAISFRTDQGISSSGIAKALRDAMGAVGLRLSALEVA